MRDTSNGADFLFIFLNAAHHLNFNKQFIKLSLLFALLFLPLSQVLAADINVDADCSLSEAIDNANDNAATHSDCEAGNGDDSISLTQDVTLSTTLPTVTSTITINGNSHSISGDDKYRIFHLTSSAGNLTLNRITLRDGRAISGGAVMHRAGSLTINNSAIRDSQAYLGVGGGITISGGTVAINNSTLSGNSAVLAGAAYLSQGALTLTHVTIAGNAGTTSSSVGGLILMNGSLSLRNSILANNGRDLSCGTSLSQNMGNLVENQRGCSSPLLSSDPNLGGLTGAPVYYPLQAGSPAIDAADADYCLAFDQRGTIRSSTACDIGAYEYVGANNPTHTPTTTNTPTPTNTRRRPTR